MAVVVESLDEFRRRQACAWVEANGLVLFANGAVSDGYTHQDPAEDSRAGRRAYLRARLAAEEREWSAFRDHCIEQAAMHRSMPRACPGPSLDAPAQLRAGRDRIHALRRELAGLEEQAPPPAEKPWEADQRARVAAVESELKSLEL